MDEANVIDERISLRSIFARSPDDPVFRNKLAQLCASYLGGIWRSVSSQQIRVNIQKGGSNNSIFVIRLPNEMKPEGDEPQEAILRIYRNLTKDYELPEGIICIVLAEQQLGPHLLGIFSGGRFEEYIPSRPLTNDEFCNPCVAQEIGRILARIHSLNMPINKTNRLAQFVDDMIEFLKSSNRWLTSYSMNTTLAAVDKKLCPERITVELLAKELEKCNECLAQSGSPIVFSNNDLHEGNLLLRDGIEITEKGFINRQDDKDPIVLIDYEYGCYYYRGFDLCHYCVECCQHNEGKVWPYYEIKQNQWPNEEIQRLYVGAYIDEATKIWCSKGGKKIPCINDLSDDRELAIQRLLNEIRQFAAVPQLFWAIWSFRQAETHQTGFGYTEYAFDRLAMYYYWKPEMLKYLNH
uniref:Aminoglycoside phosphotransferase domain-containing protein n=1 Tax=Setaria digitata TaxID=48799 RepID=A0A915PNZ2_9BILA